MSKDFQKVAGTDVMKLRRIYRAIDPDNRGYGIGVPLRASNPITILRNALMLLTE